MKVFCVGVYRFSYDPDFKGLAEDQIDLDTVIEQLLRDNPDSFEEYLKQFDFSAIHHTNKFDGTSNEEILKVLQSTQSLHKMADIYNFCRGREKYLQMMNEH